MRLLFAAGGTLLLASMLQGCQSDNNQFAFGSTSMTVPPPLERSPPPIVEQPSGPAEQARAYAARLQRDGCIKSREGALFDSAAGALERDMAATKDADTEAAMALAEARLQVGDAASASGCLDIANAQYRALLRAFPGPRYATYRQKAELGLSASQL